MFIRLIIKQTKMHFKILELLVITFGTGRYGHTVRVFQMTVSDFVCKICNERSSSVFVRECTVKNQNSHVTLRFRIKAE